MTDSFREGSWSRADLRYGICGALLGVLAAAGDGAWAASWQESTSIPEPNRAEVSPRGHRNAADIAYGDWRKLCFKAPGAKTLCRTSITGKFATGQVAVRIDLIESEGGSARLQLFLPVGAYLQAGVKLSVDKESSYRVPYTWCLANGCVAAQLVKPRLIKQMESGRTLALEIVDTNILSVTASVPLAQFAAVHKGAPESTFEQAIDE